MTDNEKTAAFHDFVEAVGNVDETSTLRRFDLFDHNGFGSLLQPAAHPDWPFSPHSKVNPDQQAKTPAVLYSDGFARGLVDWTNLWAADKRALRQWQQMGCPDRPANVSLRTGEVPGAPFFCCAVDVDVECPVLAAQIIDLTRACLGYSPKRGRGGSPRALMLYRLKPGAAALSKIRVCFVECKRQGKLKRVRRRLVISAPYTASHRFNSQTTHQRAFGWPRRSISARSPPRPQGSPPHRIETRRPSSVSSNAAAAAYRLRRRGGD